MVYLIKKEGSNLAGKRKSRQRIIAIMQYLREFGEDGQKIDIAHLQDYLQELSSNRQIIYNDLKALEELGAGIEHNKNGHYIYKPQSFSSGELMLLADVICSSSFLSAKKAEELITHIKQMTNMKGFDDLSHDIDVVLRNKTINEECIKNIECIHKAIREKKKLTFSYAKYDEAGELWYAVKTDDDYKKVFPETNVQSPLEPSERVGIHTVSPYKLIWDNSQCYLICGKKYESNDIKILNFRADRIYGLSVLDEENDKPDMSSDFYDPEKEVLDAEKYLRSIFEMFGSKDGKLTTVNFVVSKKLKGAMIDKFGKQINFIDYDEHHLSFMVPIQKSDIFFGWLAKFRYDDLRIVSPSKLISDFKDHLQTILEGYEKNN